MGSLKAPPTQKWAPLYRAHHLSSSIRFLLRSLLRPLLCRRRLPILRVPCCARAHGAGVSWDRGSWPVAVGGRGGGDGAVARGRCDGGQQARVPSLALLHGNAPRVPSETPTAHPHRDQRRGAAYQRLRAATAAVDGACCRCPCDRRHRQGRGQGVLVLPCYSICTPVTRIRTPYHGGGSGGGGDTRNDKGDGGGGDGGDDDDDGGNRNATQRGQ